MQAKKKRKGRAPIWMKCKLCKKKMLSAEMRKHEPVCRRERLMKIGAKFTVRSGMKIVPVEITRLPEDGYAMEVRNLETGRLMRLKSHRRLREWMDRTNYRFKRPVAKETTA